MWSNVLCFFLIWIAIYHLIKTKSFFVIMSNVQVPIRSHFPAWHIIWINLENQMNQRKFIMIFSPTLSSIFVFIYLFICIFIWLDMFRWNDTGSDRKILGSKQENGIKSILAWTTRHEKILPGKTKVLKCSSGVPQCIWTNDRRGNYQNPCEKL